MKRVALVGTFDSKGKEYLYVKHKMEQCGIGTLTIHAGVFEPAFIPDIGNADVATLGGGDIRVLRKNKERGTAMEVLGKGLCRLIPALFKKGMFDGILALGGSGGTSLVTPAMQLLPLGVPKIMVSTMASGDVKRYVGTSDILMMPSIVDVAGVNRISAQVFTHAVYAMAGMLSYEEKNLIGKKPVIAATMYGVTTPCIMQAKQYLEKKGYEVIVFHASGTGGQIMESLISQGVFQGVLDLTTTEWIDEICGGIMSAGPERLSAAALCGIPQVVSVGAIDMITFGSRNTLPSKFERRKIYMHNPAITVVRSNVEENVMAAGKIAEKLNQCIGEAIVLLPVRGISMNDKEGSPYYGPQEDYALFYTLEKLIVNPLVKVVTVDAHINDEMFALTAAKTLEGLMKQKI